jgi:hypothetical protein
MSLTPFLNSPRRFNVTFSQSQIVDTVDYGLVAKSFLLWTLILTVCLLIIGFPAGILIVGIGSLLAVALQAVMPGGMVFVAAMIIGLQLVGVMVAAAVLTFKGIHPQDVTWLRWLNGEADPLHETTYASCPLTCEIDVL